MLDTESEMAKRKWLCSDNVSQNMPTLSHHQESLSNQLNQEETNAAVDCLTQKPSEDAGYQGSKHLLSLDKAASDISVDEDTQELSDAPVNAGSKDSSPDYNIPLVSVNEANGGTGAPEANVSCQEDSGNLKLLTEKLTAAILNVSIKDDLVKQHSKVAEEAVAGWEKAENEAAALKQHLDAAVHSRSALEARVSHLDEALKECVRQLRLGREEQERKIVEAVAEKTSELEVAKTKLEEQLVELQESVGTSRVRSPDPDLQSRLEYMETENTALRQQLQAQWEELEVRTIERDLSTKAAETASKQHLDSIKKVARLEAECRKLKSLPRVSSFSNDHRSASSYVESFADSQSDGLEQISASGSNGHKMNGWGVPHERTPSRSGSAASSLITELNQFKSEKVVDKTLHSSVEINLMDDFLEMEQLAAMPDSSPQVPAGRNQASKKPSPNSENKLKAELNSLARRTAELEENIGRVEEEKAELETALAQTQSCLEISEVQLIEGHIKLEHLERDLRGANEGEEFFKTMAKNFEKEAELMASQMSSLRQDISRERASSEEKSSRLEELERVLENKEQELRMQQDLIANGEWKLKEVALAESQDCLEKSQAQLVETEGKLKLVEKELQEANKEKKSLILGLDAARVEVDSISAQIESLNRQVHEKQDLEVELSAKVKELERMSSEMKAVNQQMQKEQALVEELSTQVKELERELQQKRLQLDAQQRAHSNTEMKIKQEDLTAAAGKLADCQKTIASLGTQLKSLATLEDFLIDTASIQGFSPPAPLMSRRSSVVPWKLHSNDTFLAEKGLEPLSPTRVGFSQSASQDVGDRREPPASIPSSAFFLNHPSPKKAENGFANYYSISRNSLVKFCP